MPNSHEYPVISPADEAFVDMLSNAPVVACQGQGRLFFPQTEAFITQIKSKDDNGEVVVSSVLRERVMWDESKVKVAKALCAICPILTECREYALGKDDGLDGIWGGTLPAERKQLRRDLRNRYGRLALRRAS